MLEIMMKKGRRPNRKRKQRGGKDFRPKGLVRRGSGNIDPTSQYGLPVDDVPAILGRNEYVFNANAVKELGEPFLDNLNAIGLGNSTLPRGTGNYGNYQRGGRVRRQRGGRGRLRRQMGGRGRVRRQTGGNQSCGSNQHWMPPINGRPGYCMGGATHPGGGYRRGGRVRRQQGGLGSNLPTPWAGHDD